MKTLLTRFMNVELSLINIIGNSSFCKSNQVFGQSLSIRRRNRIVVADSDALDASVARQAQKPERFSFVQKRLLGSKIAAPYAEANVHATAHVVVRHDLIHGRIVVENAVQQRGFLVRQGFLPADLGGAMTSYERIDDYL